MIIFRQRQYAMSPAEMGKQFNKLRTNGFGKKITNSGSVDPLHFKETFKVSENMGNLPKGTFNKYRSHPAFKTGAKEDIINLQQQVNMDRMNLNNPRKGF